MSATMSLLIQLHLLAAVIALPLGLQQLLARKGTRTHAMAGRIYIVVMLIALLSALLSFRPDREMFLFFYLLAIVGLVTLASGLIGLRRWLKSGDPKQLRRHKTDMAFSWLGLFMAGVSQIAINPRFGFADLLPPLQYWIAFALLNIVVYGMGSWWIFRRLLADDGSSTVVGPVGRPD